MQDLNKQHNISDYWRAVIQPELLKAYFLYNDVKIIIHVNMQGEVHTHTEFKYSTVQSF